MIIETPYEYHNGKLGFKISFLISDKCQHERSLKLVKYKTLYKRINSATAQEKQLRKPSPFHPTLILFDSLSFHWQALIKEAFGPAPEEIRRTFFSKLYEQDAAAFRFYSQKYTEGTERRRLTPEKVIEYTANASVLNTVRIAKEKRRSLRKEMNSSCANIWEILSTEVNNFTEAPHTLPLSPDGLRKKFDAYEKGGYKSLVDGRRNNKNAQKVDDRIVKLINDLFAGQNYKPTATDVSRMYEGFLGGYVEIINRETGEQYQATEFPKISQSTIINYLAQWENTIATHQLRGGNRQINLGKFTPPHHMELPILAGSLLSIDDRQPPFYYDKGKRAWFYLGFDVASGCFTAFVYGKSKEGIIREFYRELIRNYTEWGLNLPYELECESSLNSSFKDTFLHPGAMFQKVRIEANNARGKYIERVFSEVRYGVEKKAIGWVARPKAISENNQAAPGQNVIIPWDILIQSRLKEIEDWNNSAHRSNNGQSCFEYFLENQNPDIPETNWISILPHLGNITPSSCKVGSVQLQNEGRWLAEDGKILLGEELIARMKRIEGNDVTVYWLDGHDGSVLKALAYIGDEYICELLPPPPYNRAQAEQTEQCIKNREIQSKYVASVEAFAKVRKNEVDKVLVIDNQPKTLNRKFVIPGLKTYQTRETPVETIEQEDEDQPTRSSGTGQANSFRTKFSINN